MYAETNVLADLHTHTHTEWEKVMLDQVSLTVIPVIISSSEREDRLGELGTVRQMLRGSNNNKLWKLVCMCVSAVSYLYIHSFRKSREA